MKIFSILATNIHRQLSGNSPLAGRLAALALAGGLAGCGPVGGIGAGGKSNVERPEASIAGPVADASQIGSGPVKVALILPLTQASGPSAVGVSLRNAAEMAVADSGGNEVTVLVKDDHSTPEGARDAAQAALNEGAEAIVGPLFAPNVREVGRLARAANRSVIAFSTDASTASRGVYLLSFLVESYVDRIIDFSTSRGKKSFAALIPSNDYGRVAEAEFQAVVARKDARVMSIEHYAPGGAAAAVQKIAALQGQIDALFIPEQADAMGAVSQALTASGLDSKKIQILGTGLWNDARVLKLPALQGAWFAAPDNGGFNAFAARYRGKFGSDPTRVATLSYDAVSLVAALARQQGSQRFAENVLTNPSGFNGADGVFRFRTDGQNERGLAVLGINNGTISVVSPAPKSFAGVPSGT